MERQPRRKNEKRRSSRPTSNHNLALCRVVCRGSEEAVGNEFVRFGGLSCLRVSASVLTKSAGIFSRLKFTFESTNDVTPAYRRVFV